MKPETNDAENFDAAKNDIENSAGDEKTLMKTMTISDTDAEHNSLEHNDDGNNHAGKKYGWK